MQIRNCAVLRAVFFSGGISPFAYVFACVSGLSAEGVCAVMGAVAGYLLRGVSVSTVRYVFASGLSVLILFILRSFSFTGNKYFRPLLLSVVSAATVFVFIDSFQTAVFFVFETAAVTFSAFAFDIALSPKPAEAGLVHGLSAALTAAVFCASLSGVLIYGVLSVGRFCAVLIIMATAYKCGCSYACTLAVVMGIFTDITGDKGLFFSFVYPFTAVTSSLFTKKGTFLFTLVFVISNFLSATFLFDNYFFIPSLYEAFAAGIIFMLIPQPVLRKYHALFPSDKSSYGTARSRLYVKNRLELAAKAFRKLYLGSGEIVSGGKNDENIALIFDRAAEISCRKCKNMDACWNRGYETTVDVLNGLSGKLLKDGFISPSDFPAHFLRRCGNIELFASAINGEARSLIYRRQYREKFRESMAAAYSHYANMYLLLKSTAAEIGGEGREDTKTERKLRKYMRTNDLSASASAFRDRSGRLHIEFTGDGASAVIKNAELLDDLSAAVSTRLCSTGIVTDGRLTVLEAEPYCVSVGVSTLSRDGSRHNGDTGRFFKTEDGIMYVILSDGIGTGKAAEKCSRDTVGVLELFLKAGLPPETALRILSDAMILKNEAEIYSAAIDLLCIDLFSGRAKIFKSGAAPTYIRNGTSVKKIKNGSFLPGFSTDPDFEPDTASLHFAPDITAFIISDSILEGRVDGWLVNLLATNLSASPAEQARIITSESEKRFGRNDDMTAICVKFDVRK